MVPADGCITCGAQIPKLRCSPYIDSNETMEQLHKVKKTKAIQKWWHNITLDAEQWNSPEIL